MSNMESFPANSFGQPSQPMPGNEAPNLGKKSLKKPRRTKGEARADRAVTRRVINSQKIGAGILAVIVAVLVIALAGSSTTRTYVVRVNGAVPALGQVAPSQLEAISLPVDAIEEGALSGEDADALLEEAIELAKNGVVRQSLPAGRQLHPADFSAEAQLVVPLGADERLASIEARVGMAVGGGLKVGDRVDVIARFQVRDESEFDLSNATTTASTYVAHNIELVSVLPDEGTFDQVAQGQTADSDASPTEQLPAEPVPGIYVVRVSTRDAQILDLAQDQADLYLVLRGANASDPTTAEAVSLGDIIRLGPDQTIIDPNDPLANDLFDN